MTVSNTRRRALAGAGGLLLQATIGRCLGAEPDPSTSSPSSTSSSTSPILIGFAGGLGNKLLTNLSFSARDGALLAIEEANQRKLVIAGKPAQFKLVAVDDQSDVNFARLVAASFVNAGMVAVIGHNTTETSVATSPIYADAGIALISPTSTGRSFTSRGYTNVFQLLGHSDVTTGYLTEVARQVIRARRIAVLDNGTTLGQELAQGVVRKLTQEGAETARRESVTPKTSDFNAVLQRIRNSDPDLLFFTGGGPQIEPFLQSLQRLNLQCRLLVTGGALNLEFPRTGLYPEGAYLLTHGLPPERRPGFAEFEKAYRRRFDTAISGYTMFSYDAAAMVIEAMRRNNSSAPRLLMAELHRMKYNGISGGIAFANDGSQLDPPYTLYQASQGQWRPIRSWGGSGTSDGKTPHDRNRPAAGA